ncbi:MAG TPA: hypothetical protein VGU43_01590 [Thermoplasmata archaeon]|nr:hypothetical protein [Thermoplasmata archaeon]
MGKTAENVDSFAQGVYHVRTQTPDAVRGRSDRVELVQEAVKENIERWKKEHPPGSPPARIGK